MINRENLTKDFDEENEKSILLNKRLLLVKFFTAIIFVLLIFYLIFFVLKNYENYNHMVLSQRQNAYKQETFLAKRGSILDKNGNKLAESSKVYNLILDPKVMHTYDDNRFLDPTLEALSEVYEIDYLDLRDNVEKRKNSQYYRLLKKITPDEKTRFENYADEKNNEYIKTKSPNRIRGVWFEDDYKRYYKFDSILSNTIGFINEENSPVMGLELYYQNDLSGVDGRSFGFLDNKYNLSNITSHVKNGENIYTTFDLDIQRVVEDKIRKWQEEDIGSKKAACIVMDPRDGSILAMAGSNSFDLNNPRVATPSEGVPIEETLYKNWYNICVQDTYEPGSTAKVFTVAAALEENLVNDKTTFECKGNIELDDGEHKWTIKCNNRNGHGKLDLKGSIVNSCNMCMSEMSELLGIDKFTEYQKIFGIGKPTNIDLPSEPDTSKLIYTKDNMGRTDLATNSFGQNFNVTMLQLISGFASIINGGDYYEPYIVKKIEDENGTIIYEKDITPLRKTVSKKTSDFIKNALFETVEKGTGRAARVRNFQVAGKTGTAEKLPREDKKYLVSFIGYYPIENPEKLIYVIVDEPNLEGEAQANSKFACNIFKEIVEVIKKY